jgi:hypothetical protein
MVFDKSTPAATGYVELYGVMPPGSTPAVTFELASRPDAAALATAAGRVLGSAEPDRFVATGSLSLDAVPAGDYVLRAVLSVNGQTAGRVFRTLHKE